MADRAIKKIRIHPAIGVARLGNSLEHCFVGPEIPGIHPAVSEYRDSRHCLKRQGARFRLFAYDRNDNVIGEISRNSADIEGIRWTVHLKNTKAAGRRFEGLLHQDSRFRNEAASRNSLVLDPGSHVVDGLKHKKMDMFCTTFMHKKFTDPLKLGTLLTKADGRLLVLGGHGRSDTLTGAKLDEPGDDFANHDGWYDDTSDGSIRASVTFNRRGRRLTVEAVPSWVIVAPPKYAPSLLSVVTLYDVLYQLALKDPRRDQWMKSAWLKRILQLRPKPSFRKDIYPILRRAYEMRYVFARAEVGHENEIDMARLSSKGVEELTKKAPHIFRQFRIPSPNPKTPGSGTGKMPYIWSDLYQMDDDQEIPHPVNATLTQLQYDVMQAWASGNFHNDGLPPSPPRDHITPEGLDRAALEPCVGAAFFPGIETSFHIRDKFSYIEPFRLDASKIRPGDVTQQMSLPWQTDFVDCSDGDLPLVWWPAQRPIDVRLENADPKVPAVRWARDFKGNTSDVTAREMVDEWWRLGLLKPVSHGVVETLRVNRLPPKSRRKRQQFPGR
jgi:hypothetical protein